MNFECWTTGAWAASSWVEGSWCPGGEPPTPSAGNYVQRVVGRTTRAEDFARPRVVDVDGLRRKREEEEIIIL